MSVTPPPEAAHAHASAPLAEKLATPVPVITLTEDLLGASTTDPHTLSDILKDEDTDPSNTSGVAIVLPDEGTYDVRLRKASLGGLDLERMPEAASPDDVPNGKPNDRKKSSFASFVGFRDPNRSPSPGLDHRTHSDDVGKGGYGSPSAFTPSIHQHTATLSQILHNHPGATANRLVVDTDTLVKPDIEHLSVFPQVALSERFKHRAQSSVIEPIVAIHEPLHIMATVPEMIEPDEEHNNPDLLSATGLFKHGRSRSGEASNPGQVSSEPGSPTTSRSNSPKPSSRWGMARKMKSVTSIFKATYVPPPYASFVSYQLQKYLETINIDQLEHPTGSVKLGAVLFSDASGFTAMTQRLASRVSFVTCGPSYLSITFQYNGAELLCSIINDFFTKLLAVVEEYGGDVVKVSHLRRFRLVSHADSVCWRRSPHHMAS